MNDELIEAGLPVEPEYLIRLRNALKGFKSDGAFAGDKDIVDYIDSLQSALKVAQQELLDTTWQDHADHWKKRAEQAEKDRDICYISLQDMRRRLHEIASLVTDPRLDEKHTA